MSRNLKPYLELKRDMLRAGLFSCSQVGFNIALGDLPRLRADFCALFTRVFAATERWVVPPMIREDWIPADSWDSPGSGQWVRTEPLGHVLTPLPAMHLFNRLRHHPASGSFHLSGWCCRQETDTLPLLRQVSFTIEERVQVGKTGVAELLGPIVFAKLAALAQQLELPVEETRNEGHEGACLSLQLPDTPEVPLAAFRNVDSRLLSAYDLDWAAADRVSCGVERWCLALIARHGTDPGNWPDLAKLQP
jgi:hypothetical protein